MPVETRWYVPNRVVLARFYGDVVLEDYHSSRSGINGLIEIGDAPVHTIVSVTDVNSYPKDLNAVRQILAGGHHPNVGWIVVITDNKVLRFFASVITQYFVANARLHMVTNFADAAAYIFSRDNTIDPQAVVNEPVTQT